MVTMQGERVVKYRNGRYAKKGTCPECQGKVVKTIVRPRNLMERIFFFIPRETKKKEEEEKQEGQGQPAPE